MAATSEPQRVFNPAAESDVENVLEKPPHQDDWKPSGHELLIIITLAIASLLVALDASIIVTSLSVGLTIS